jgi:Raf kinase inhibitor-like YbhB/YbcL family protein
MLVLLPLLKKMKLESPVFLANELIPSQYTCDGQDISPPLDWDEPPLATKSLVLICDDPDAPRKTWVHWVVYNLPSETRSLPENISPSNPLPKGGLQGINDFGKVAYGGPCPPSGTHRYFFKLYALDRVLEIKVGATKTQIEQAMKDHILAQSELIGRYHRQ